VAIGKKAKERKNVQVH